jgi:hypothetical protein
MNRKNYLAVVAVVASLLASPAVHAAPVGALSPIHAMFGDQIKSIRFTLRNDSSTMIALKVDDKVMRLPVGKTLSLKLPIGTRIVADNDTPTHPSGSLIEEVCKEHDGATISIR